MTDLNKSLVTSPIAHAESSFRSLPLSAAMLATLQQLGYVTMTPIQAASLPFSLKGQDLIAQAKTGSGKTASFTLPLLANLNPRRFAVQALVLCPTRELADQVAQEIRRLARALGNIKVLVLCGGSVMREQVSSLEHGAHIIVGTPGRIMDHIERETLRLDALNSLVLDEADRMMDMGFYDDIAFISKRCPGVRQTLMFSATFPDGVKRLARQFMRNPQEVKLLEKHEGGKIVQRFYKVEESERLQVVGQLLKQYRPVSTLAFCNTKQQCRSLLDVLHGQGIYALTLNGDLEQRERDQVLIQFAHQSCSVLVATDVAARGLDIAQLEVVINVDITPEVETHIHRIGRTGRGDQEGLVLSLCHTNDRRRIAAIAQAMNFEPSWFELSELDIDKQTPLEPPMVTLQILGGRKEKIRPGDVLGALTGDAGFNRQQIGKITITEQSAYVAVVRNIASEAVRKLSSVGLKGKSVKIRAL